MTQRLPALFIGHGSPMTMITDNPERRAMTALGARLPRPEAILCISAHWETHGATHVTGAQHPRTIHDFRGFPPELYEVRYPAPGSDQLIGRVQALAGAERIRPDTEWGFDHGTYGVVLPLFGHAEIPTVEMSLDRALDAEGHLALGKALAPLRDEGVLIVGSGNVVHNLAVWRQSAGQQFDWAVDFQARTNRAMLADDTLALTRFAPDDEGAALAINSAEHYLPLLYAAGARLPGDEVAVFNDTVSSSLSMTSYVVGAEDLIADLQENFIQNRAS